MAPRKTAIPSTPSSGQSNADTTETKAGLAPREILGLLFALCCVASVPIYMSFMLFHKEYALRMTPDLFPSMNTVTWSHVIPPHPHNMTQAWALGRISEALLHCASENTSCSSVLLQQAATVLGRSTPLTLAELRDAKMYMEDMENHRGMISRMYGAMNMVNTMWLLGAAGVLIFIVPATLACFHQCGLWSVLYAVIRLAASVLSRVGLWLYLNTYFLWCPLVYGMVAISFAHAVRSYDANPTIASYMGAATLVIHAMTLFAHFQFYPGRSLFVVLLHSVHAIRTLCCIHLRWQLQVVRQVITAVVLGYYTLLAGGLAILLQSRLMGFIATVTVFANLGFVIVPFGLGLLIGFEDDSGMRRCKLGSLAICSIFLLIRTSNDSGLCYQPSQMNLCFPLLTATQSFGAVVFFLAQLISASSIWNRDSSGGYWKQQMGFLVAVAVSLVVGLLWDVTSLVATSFTFLVLYAAEKVAESNFWNTHTIVIGAAMGSFLLWRLAAFLSLRPDIAGFLIRIVCAIWNDEDLQNAEISSMLPLSQGHWHGNLKLEL
jgi:hypothetical protein